MWRVAPRGWCDPVDPRLIWFFPTPSNHPTRPLAAASTLRLGGVLTWPRIQTSKLFRHLPIYVVT